MELSSFPSRIAEEHELFLFALNGKYLQQLTPGSRPTPRDVVDFSAWAARIRDALKARVSDAAAELVASVPLSEESRTGSKVMMLVNEFKAEFARITLNNVQSVVNLLRVGRDDLGKTFTAPLRGAMGELMLKHIQKVEFKAPDTAGRKWDANRLISFVAREFAYRLMLVSQLEAAGPDDLAEVFYPDHDSDGLVFSISGKSTKHPSFASLESTVFHPNSKAEVVRHGSPT